MEIEVYRNNQLLASGPISHWSRTLDTTINFDGIKLIQAPLSSGCLDIHFSPICTLHTVPHRQLLDDSCVNYNIWCTEGVTCKFYGLLVGIDSNLSGVVLHFKYRHLEGVPDAN